MITDQDRWDVDKWRGLDDAVMSELDELNQRVIDQGTDRAIKGRQDDIRGRARCRELRKAYGLTNFQKLRISAVPLAGHTHP